MIPDYVSLKRSIQKKLERIASLTLEQGSMISLCQRFRIREGDHFVIHRRDGSSDRREYKTAEGETQVSPEGIRDRGIEAIYKGVDTVIAQIRDTTEGELLRVIKEACDKTGQKVIADRPFSAELFLEGLEKIQLDFDRDGNWVKPGLVIPPQIEETVKYELERLETDHDLHHRLDQIVARKKEEWIVREADRKLVD